MTLAAHISVAREMTGGDESPWYNCATCTPEMRVQMGHDGPPAYLWRSDLITDQPLRECPVRTLLRAREEEPVSMLALDAVRGTYAPAYRRNFLPLAGGIADQPAHTIALVEFHEHINELTKVALAKAEGTA